MRTCKICCRACLHLTAGIRNSQQDLEEARVGFKTTLSDIFIQQTRTDCVNLHKQPHITENSNVLAFIYIQECASCEHNLANILKEQQFVVFMLYPDANQETDLQYPQTGI